MGRHRGSDQQTRRLVRKELIKRQSVDTSLIDVVVANGVAYLSGDLRPARGGGGIDLKEELGHIETVLRQLPGIRDVVTRVKLPFH